MRRSVLSARVNIYISMAFIAAFGLVAVQTMLRSARMDDPIGNTIAATAGYNKELIQTMNQSPQDQATVP